MKVEPVSSSRVALPVRAFSRQLVERRAAMSKSDLLIGVLDHRHDQPVGRRRRDADVVALAQHDLLLLLVEGGVDDRELLEPRAHRLDDERQEGELDAALLGARLGALAQRDQLGHVALFDVGEVRRGLPRAVHVLGDLLAHAAERDALVARRRPAIGTGA